MKIIGIESSGMVASVALWADGGIVSEYTTDMKQTHSETLLPMLDEMLKRVGIAVTQIDAIAVSGGPGSFTGLRIGSATAKGLGLALNKPIINVPTLDAMAYQALNTYGIICPMMDARRDQVFTGFYTAGGDALEFHVLREAFADDISAVLKELLEIREKQSITENEGKTLMPVFFLGDGACRQEAKIRQTIPDAIFLPEFMNKQRAAVVASLGACMYRDGQTETAMEHKPEYLRVSQAEREREERLKHEQE